MASMGLPAASQRQRDSDRNLFVTTGDHFGRRLPCLPSNHAGAKMEPGLRAAYDLVMLENVNDEV
jgi:hypothetical protein